MGIAAMCRMDAVATKVAAIYSGSPETSSLARKSFPGGMVDYMSQNTGRICLIHKSEFNMIKV